MNFSTLNYKKIGLIILFVAVTVAIGYFIFSFFFKPQADTGTAPEPSSEQAGGGLPQAGTGSPATPTITPGGEFPGSGSSGGTGTATDDQADQAPSIADQAAYPSTASGSLAFYNPNDSRFYTLNPDGTLKALADKQFPGVKNVVWAPGDEKAILEYPDGSNIRYDFATGKQVTLPKHWEDFDFSPDGNKLVAKSIGLDENNRWLVISNDDGSQTQAIEPLGDNADTVISSWSPSNQVIAMYVEGVDFNTKKVFFVGQNGENFKSTTIEGRGFEPLWTPTGDQLLYSIYSADNDYKPNLWLVGAEGDSIGTNRRPLNLNTWADKCTFGQSELYCAVPRTLERGAGLQASSTSYSADLLYRINTATGTKELVSSNSPYAMNKLSVSKDGQYLYFIEGGSNRLRKIKIR